VRAIEISTGKVGDGKKEGYLRNLGIEYLKRGSFIIDGVPLSISG
jgi:hypothetical protein